ncbi:MAG TPA: glycosyltransferase family protein [Flavobacteriales bacterium]|nr:glycosyltransferase family protein [Flavobacteriales bacterium]HRE95418.1 glycosyltransferase family protein [Flavobacteriales bacterium]HRJ38072.1 glycosyltransferase family protein [Flavobacteriales bacterium]
MFNPQRILVAPLDWGLGHASRCIPLIKQYVAEGHQVILATYGNSAALLQNEFPELRSILLPGIEIRYPKNSGMKITMLKQYFTIKKAIRSEHRLLQNIIEKEKIDRVISDNRYGLYSSKTHCTIITHQLFIRAGIFSGIINAINRSYLKKFDEVWVPDFEDEKNLSGALSHGKHRLKNVKYIGPLSRYQGQSGKMTEKKFDILILLSGPEPQRSLLEIELANKLKSTTNKIALIRGTLQEIENPFTSDTLTIPMANEKQLLELIRHSEHIICRSGYSTIMDLHALGRTAEFIPTPGQTEQVYLAQLHKPKIHQLSW